MKAPANTAGLDRSTRVMLWTLLVVYIFNFIDRQIVNILAEPIARDLDLSDTQIGLMTGLAFALFYTVLGLPIARYADKPSTDRGRLIAVALAVWSVMTALCGLAQNYAQLLLARIGVGVGEAGCTPAAHSLIADRVPPDKRPGAMAFYALGIPAGTLIGMVIGGFLADTIGWRLAFMLVGLPGILMAGLVVWLIKDKDRPQVSQTATTSGESMFAAIAVLLRSPAYVMLLAAGSASSFLAYGKVTWTVIFFQRSYDLSATEVGFWYGLANGLAGMAGTWLGGWLANRYGSQNRRHVVTAPAVGMAIAVPMAMFAFSATDWRIALLLLIVPIVCNSLYYGPVYSSAQGLVALRHRATASAFLLFAQNLIGLGLGPLFFGLLSDALKPTYGGESVRFVLYGAALLGLIPALLFWLLRPRLHAELDKQG